MGKIQYHSQMPTILWKYLKISIMDGRDKSTDFVKSFDDIIINQRVYSINCFSKNFIVLWEILDSKLSSHHSYINMFFSQIFYPLSFSNRKNQGYLIVCRQINGNSISIGHKDI